MARVALPQSRVRAKRRKRRWVAATISFAALILVVGGLAWFSHASFLRITAIQVSGEQTVTPAAITDFVQHELTGSRLYLFPKSNIFIYPQSQIIRDLPLAMPTIASVSVHALSFHSIGVDVVERQPKALWCGESVEASSSQCLLLDQSGTAYGPVDNGFVISGQDAHGYKRYFGALVGTTTLQQYLTPDTFTNLGALVDAIAQNQQQDSVTSVYVDQNSDVHMYFASGFELMFELSADGGDVYSRFQLALLSDAFQGHTIADFRYLDLRFGDRLYYKLKAQ